LRNPISPKASSCLIRAFAIPSALVLLFSFAARGAEPRPRIGLVLEGGGALGFAHIAVLEWLEQHHIPIDYIAGTSMGGLVGGMYATGKSPAEIKQIVDSIDWNATIDGQTKFQDLAYRRKEDRVAYPTRFEFGLRDGLSLPSGLNAGQAVGLVFDHALLPYSGLSSFDNLPIPFRCVATDLMTGQAKVFDRGSLSLALRATMSIPGLFSPVNIDGHIYSDGAAVDNLPVDIARKMGADIVIAVHLDLGPQNRKSLESLLGVVARNVAIMVAANELRSMKLADMLLNVDMSNFTSLEFNRRNEIIPYGTRAAEAKKAMLTRLSIGDDEWNRYLDARASRIKTATPPPQFIAVDGTSPEKKEVIASRLSSFLDKPIDQPKLETVLTQLSGWGYFSRLSYSLTKKDQQTGLHIRAEEKTYGPPFLNLGVTIDGTDINNIGFGMAGRITFLNVGNLRSEWRTDAFFGTNNGITSEYYRAFSDSSKWFVAPRAYLTRTEFNIYNDRDRIAQYFQLRKGGGIDFGYALSPRAEIRVGQDIARYSMYLKLGLPIVDNAAAAVAISSARFQYLGQDDAVIPRSGLIHQSTFQWYSARVDGGAYPSLQTRTSIFRRTSARGSVFGTAAGGTTFGATGLDLQSFSLGGPLQLGAYGRNELLGNQYFLLQAGYLHELFRLSPLTGSTFYAAALYEVGKVYGDPLLPKLPNDFSFALIGKTAIGPVFVGGSVGDSGHRKWWFGVGRIF
jgi:NTE family protein